MKFDIDYIDKLAKVLNENGLTELVLENEEQSIILKKESALLQQSLLNYIQETET